jgi:hypothetical protein
VGRDGGGYRSDLGRRGTEKFFAMGLDSPDHTKSGPSGSGFFGAWGLGGLGAWELGSLGAWGLAHSPHPVSGFLPETRPYALMNSTGINARYPAYHGLGPMSPLRTARDIERAILRPHRRGRAALAKGQHRGPSPFLNSQKVQT